MPHLTTLDLLAAMCLPGVGSATVRKLYEQARLGIPMSADIGLEKSLVGVLRTGTPLPTSADLKIAYDDAHEILNRSALLSITTLSPLDQSYPRRLLDLADFPPILYVKGSLSTVANSRKVALVGTREASALGLRLARTIASEISQLGICVVSGLATGIDTAAHQGAITGSGSTIAVMAHGLDQVAPKANEQLAQKILESNGALVSEHEVGVIPRPPQFVTRNRLQSGLSRASVVIESGFSGGSIHQGKFTGQQGRLLFVIKPDALDEGASAFKREGAERLEAEYHAKAVRGTAEILDFIPEFLNPPPDTSPLDDRAISSTPPSQQRLFE